MTQVLIQQTLTRFLVCAELGVVGPGHGAVNKTNL